jgi:hypothetical protein
VGDAKDGHIQVFVVEECVECLLDEFFGLAVEGGGGFIEDKERRPFNEGARDGDALLLAARKPSPAEAHVVIEFLRLPRDEVVHVDLNEGGFTSRSTAQTSASEASARPTQMFSLTEPLKRVGSCPTYPTFSRSHPASTSAMSRPPMSTRPASAA